MKSKININKDDFEKLCRLQCTLVEISSWFSCSKETIENWCKQEYDYGFSEIYKKYSDKGKTLLRISQFRLAERNVAMAIWLGKQYLNQKENNRLGNKEDKLHE